MRSISNQLISPHKVGGLSQESLTLLQMNLSITLNKESKRHIANFSDIRRFCSFKVGQKSKSISLESIISIQMNFYTVINEEYRN